MKDVLDIILRGLLSLVTLFLVTKMIGKKQVSQLSLFDYVIGISIGNFAADATLDLGGNYLHGVVPVFLFGFVAYIVSVATMKSIKLRRFFIGTPTIIIYKGKIITKALKKVKFDINDLQEVARNNGYFDLNDIYYAIVEADGDVSFLLKADKKMVTVGDMKFNVNKASLCANVVIDGKIMKNNLKNIGKDVKWFNKELKKRNIESLEDIILITVDDNYNMVIYNKNEDDDLVEIFE